MRGRGWRGGGELARAASLDTDEQAGPRLRLSRRREGELTLEEEFAIRIQILTIPSVNPCRAKKKPAEAGFPRVAYVSFC